MISLSQIRTLFSKKQSAHTAEPLRVERIWSIELMLAAVLLVAFAVLPAIRANRERLFTDQA